MRCPHCARWEFRDRVGTTGLTYVERTCPRCNGRALLFFRGCAHLATVAIHGRRDDAGRIESALAHAGFTPEEQRLLVEVARVLSQVPRA